MNFNLKVTPNKLLTCANVVLLVVLVVSLLRQHDYYAYWIGPASSYCWPPPSSAAVEFQVLCRAAPSAVRCESLSSFPSSSSSSSSSSLSSSSSSMSSMSSSMSSVVIPLLRCGLPETRLCASSQLRWRSQMYQDRLVLLLLQGKYDGFYVDLAANDAMSKSNTWVLDRLYGWHGICWEANPSYWYRLATRRTCAIVGGAAFDQDGAPVSFAFRTTLGGIANTPGIADNQHRGASETVPTATLTSVLDRLHAPTTIDYLSLDVEGAESFALRGLDFNRYTISVMTIERPQEDAKQLLQENGYTMLFELASWGETLWVHDTLLSRLGGRRDSEYPSRWKSVKSLLSEAKTVPLRPKTGLLSFDC